MKLLLDTNTLIDHLAQREPFAKDMRTLYIASFFGDVELWASVQSYLDALYSLRKHADQRELRDAALGTLEFIHPCGTRAADLEPALQSDWQDVEDFVIAQSASNVSADYLVTRDIDGFGKAAVPVATPAQIVAKLEDQGLHYDSLPI